MSGSNVSSVVNLLPTVNEGFSSSLSSTISSGAASLPLTTVSGLVNGTVFVGIIDPGLAAQQTFTGTVDTGGLQITGVKWTRGNNVAHVGGAAIVDIVTGTAINMISRAMSIEHHQSGAHSVINADLVNQNGGPLVPTGCVVPYSGSSSPTGWLLCDGTAVSRTTYANLFAVTGTTHGTGDGSTTFNLPNLKGRSVFGKDAAQTEFATVGHTGGQKDIMQHHHDIVTTNDDFNSSGANPPGWAADSAGTYHKNTEDTGTGVNNLNPYLVLNYIIKV